MAKIALILGESGSGKSRSIKGLPPKETFVITGGIQDLPFKGAEKLYKPISEENPKGNFLRTEKLSVAAKYLRWVNKSRPEIKYVVIDDNQYFSMFTYVNRAYERDYYSKFVDIGVALVEFAKLCKSLRDDITVFILNHVETGTSAMGNEQIQAKTLGKFVKEKITYEGLFQPVLLCDKEVVDGNKTHHFFWTELAGSVVKAPEEMFEDQKVDNDLKLVADAMTEYYS
jgi:hypothetical protein